MLLPVLEPDLNRSLGHVNVRGNTLPDHGGGCGVLVKLDLECDQLILCSPLSLLVLLLLSQGALARGSAGAVEVGNGRDSRSRGAWSSGDIW